jgi:hypothetical protein
VAGLHRHAQLEQLALGFHHAGQHALGDRAEVVIFQLLALRPAAPNSERPAVYRSGREKIEVTVDQEVLLLGAGGGGDHRGVGVTENVQDALRLCVERLHRAEHRGLLVEGFTGPRQNAVGMHSVVPFGFSRM